MLMNISLKKRTLLVLLSGLTATFTLAQQQPLPEWQSQYAVGLNKLAPHTYVWPYANASDIEKPGGYEQSPFYMSLNGKWKFHWVKNPDNRPKDFTNLLIIQEDGRISMCPVTGNARGMARLSMSTKRMSLMIKCSTSRRIRRWCLMQRMKSAPTDVPSKCLPTGKDAG